MNNSTAVKNNKKDLDVNVEFSSSKFIDNKRRYSFNVFLDDGLCFTSEYFRYSELHKSVQLIQNMEYNFPPKSYFTNFETSEADAERRGKDIARFFNRLMNSSLVICLR